MSSNGLGEEAEALRSQEVDGAELLNLTFEELTEGFGFSQQSAMNLLMRKEFTIRTILEACAVDENASMESRHNADEEPKLQHSRSLASNASAEAIEECIDLGVLLSPKSS